MSIGIPVSSIALAAVNWGQHEAKRLIRFKPGANGPGPSWEGRGEDITTTDVGIPVTDRAYWEGRFVLCELTLESENGERLTFADAVAAVSRENRIVCTALTGRDGTVKEYINASDWSVNIVLGIQPVRNGVITDDYPDDELRQLCKLLDSKKALKVHSEFLDIFNIDRLVIKGYSATQMTEANYQAISVSAVSDEDYEIFSKDYQQPKN